MSKCDCDRDSKGRFCRGNPGKPPGTQNRTTIDARLIKREVCESWFEGHAKAKLLELLDKRPVDYFRFVGHVLPRELMADVSVGDTGRRTYAAVTPAAREFQRKCELFGHEHGRAPGLAEIRAIRNSILITDEDLGINGVTTDDTGSE